MHCLCVYGRELIFIQTVLFIITYLWVRQSFSCVLVFVLLFTLIRFLFIQVFNIPTVPGKVIILHKSISCPNGGQTHAERQEKKSIGLINLTHFAILHSLLWINEVACSFNSACCTQFSMIFADKTPHHIRFFSNLCQIQIVWLCLIESAWCSGGLGISGTWATAKCTLCQRGEKYSPYY